jgi:hypothetical protein
MVSHAGPVLVPFLTRKLVQEIPIPRKYLSISNNEGAQIFTRVQPAIPVSKINDQWDQYFF